MEQKNIGRNMTYIVRYFFGIRQKTAAIKIPSAADITVIVKVKIRFTLSIVSLPFPLKKSE
ncbi:MAG: hypothetical protein K1W34_12790 [Lachnospiraceae bacterium]